MSALHIIRQQPQPGRRTMVIREDNVSSQLYFPDSPDQAKGSRAPSLAQGLVTLPKNTSSLTGVMNSGKEN